MWNALQSMRSYPPDLCATNWCFSSIICIDTSPEKQTCKVYVFKKLSQGFSSFKLNFLLCICFSEQYFLWKYQTLAQSPLIHGLYMPYTFFTPLMSAVVSMGPTSLKTKHKRYLYTVLHPNQGCPTSLSDLSSFLCDSAKHTLQYSVLWRRHIPEDLAVEVTYGSYQCT